ncbi:type IV secretion system protein [Xanthomonas albilineans]|uniref:Probable type iv secretion system protein virb6 n=1 Tax=Xanthomonas albilineans (strain GPE PC73 / CFBP 7063) TaxID=380358 RepID=D2UDS0_XANAP|nr:type IV secretion system protein [Xanthomonas albilineans]QHQ28349.1 putative type IV secretion system protein virb6 [Xanthomonas albilineans]CBA16119.1 probable type iv secretion system protein virb6 [Xanthomonas albilineans GPE PC73]
MSMFDGSMNWLHPLADTSLGDYVFFRLINNYLSNQIDTFGMDVMARAMQWVSVIALTATTFWVLLLGYRIASGQLRESAMATMIKAGKVSVILGIAAGIGANGTLLHKTMTDGLDKEIHWLFTGQKDSTAADAIDENLTYTQLALSTLDAIQVDPNDPETIKKKENALLLAGFGTAGPPIMAGVMLLMFKFTMAFLIGVGPIFILFLIFDQTKDLFKRWLFYVIGTLFSMSVLSVVTAIVLKMTARIALAYWGAKVISLGNAEGLSSQALQQGWAGLIATTLIVVLPPIGAILWQGSMANFMHFSVFNPASVPGPQGQPPGSYTPPQARENTSNASSTHSSALHGANKYITQSPPPAGSRGQAGKNRDGA